LETAISQSNGTLILNSDVTKDSSEFDKYKDGIVINKNITIIGNGFTINANNDGRIFFLNSGFTLTLINITLANAHVSLDGGNDVRQGGAIYTDGGNIIISNSRFSNNSVDLDGKGYGGAIYVSNGNLNITDSQFDNNKGRQGGAISLDDSTAWISNTIFSENMGNYHAAAINSDHSDLTVLNSTFSFGKTGMSDGAGIYVNYGNLFVEGTKFLNNTASTYGGAIYNSRANSIIKNCVFNGNYAAQDGGAVYNYYGNIDIINSVFSHNTGYYYGGVIYTYNGVINITDSTFSDNIGFWGGVIYNTVTKMTISNSSFYNNKAMWGENMASVIVNTGNLTIEDSIFENNTADTNGAIYNIGDVLISNSIFKNNVASDGNNVIMNDNGNKKGTMTIIDSTFENTIGTGNIIYNANAANLIMKNNKIISNDISLENDGAVSLFNNSMDSKESYDILNNGVINSEVILTYHNSSTNVNEEVTLKASLTDDAGNVIYSDSGLDFNVDNMLVNTTFADGFYEVTYIPKATGSFVLSGNYSKGSNVTVNNGVLTVNKKNLTITVNDTDFIYGVGGEVEIVADAPINGTVSVDFNGKTFDVELVDGKGSFTVDGDVTPGEYPVSVEFAGNDVYAPVAVNSSLTVSYGDIDLDISVSVDKETVTKGDNITVTVVVKNNGDKVIAYLNGKLADSFKLVSVDASKGTFDSDSGLWYIGPLGSGESVYLILTLEAINVGINNEEFVIFVNGTDFNKSSLVSIEVQDNKTDSNNTDVDKNLTFTVNGTNFVYGVGGEVDIVTDVPINGTVSVEFNGKTFEVELVDGKGSFTVDGDVTPGEYPVSVEFAGNDVYAPVAVNSSLTVSYGDIDLDISVSVDKETVTKGDNITVTVVVKNNGDKVIAYLNGKLADSFKLVSVDASKGTFDSDSGLWYIGPLGSGESVYLILTLEAINVGINNEEFVIFVNGTDFNKSSLVSIEVQDNKTDSNSTDVDTDDSNQSDDNQSDESIQFDEEIIGNDGSYNGYILNSNNNYSSVEKTGNPILLLLLVLLALPFVRRFKK
uniref:hypothetical protein n=1 Tax=Methanobrevibacter woesei TaxID=190976 RepID=UPI0026DEE828